jgi:uncharacterized membrane protein affecting hemolysin expression
MRLAILALLAFLATAVGAAAGPLDRDFERLERTLRLTPAQKVQFDAAVAATQRALLAVAMSGMQVKERVSAELEKPRPDLNVLYDIHEQVIEQNKPLFREVRSEWSRLYALLDPDQVATAKRFIEDKLNLLAPPPR